MIEFTIAPEEVGERLDRVLAGRLPGHSRQRLQEWIEANGVRVNGRMSKPAYRVQAGDRIEVDPIPPAEAPALIPEAIPVPILYEDDSLMVVNKPRGLTVHPAPGHPHGTLVNALLAHSPQLSTGLAAFRPGIVHRLDKDTTGLLLVAKTDYAHWQLSAALQARQIERRYLALVWGETAWEAQRVDQPIGRHPVDRKKMTTLPPDAVRAGRARTAITDFLVQKRFAGFTLLEARLHTGRTHQVRVHAAAMGHPVVGDPVYGGLRRLPAGLYPPAKTAQIEEAIRHLGGQALHAYFLRFVHPIKKEEMCFTCPPPSEFEHLVQHLDTSLRLEVF